MLPTGVTLARKRRGSCPRCHYIGNRHLCSCIAGIGAALKAGDMGKALARYQVLVDAANAEENDPDNFTVVK